MEDVILQTEVNEDFSDEIIHHSNIIDQVKNKHIRSM